MVVLPECIKSSAIVKNRNYVCGQIRRWNDNIKIYL